MHQRSNLQLSLESVLKKNMETLEALILTITVLNLVSKGLSFYYTVIFTDPLRHKQFAFT